MILKVGLEIDFASRVPRVGGGDPALRNRQVYLVLCSPRRRG